MEERNCVWYPLADDGVSGVMVCTNPLEIWAPPSVPATPIPTVRLVAETNGMNAIYPPRHVMIHSWQGTVDTHHGLHDDHYLIPLDQTYTIRAEMEITALPERIQPQLALFRNGTLLVTGTTHLQHEVSLHQGDRLTLGVICSEHPTKVTLHRGQFNLQSGDG